MVYGCGISSYQGGMYHLTTHACYKALLFLGAGAIIHAMGEEQDIRRMGGLRKGLPMTYMLMCIGGLSLMGVPYLAGYYSKDAILEIGYGTYSWSGRVGYWLGSVGALVTAGYSMRIIRLPVSYQLNLILRNIELPRKK